MPSSAVQGLFAADVFTRPNTYRVFPIEEGHIGQKHDACGDPSGSDGLPAMVIEMPFSCYIRCSYSKRAAQDGQVSLDFAVESCINGNRTTDTGENAGNFAGNCILRDIYIFENNKLDSKIQSAPGTIHFSPRNIAA